MLYNNIRKPEKVKEYQIINPLGTSGSLEHEFGIYSLRNKIVLKINLIEKLYESLMKAL